jgi:hypothetical protein
MHIIATFLYWFEHVVGWIMTSERNLPLHHRYMWEKYGTKHCSQEEYDKWEEQQLRDEISP